MGREKYGDWRQMLHNPDIYTRDQIDKIERAHLTGILKKIYEAGASALAKSTSPHAAKLSPQIMAQSTFERYVLKEHIFNKNMPGIDPEADPTKDQTFLTPESNLWRSAPESSTKDQTFLTPTLGLPQPPFELTTPASSSQGLHLDQDAGYNGEETSLGDMNKKPAKPSKKKRDKAKRRQQGQPMHQDSWAKGIFG